MIRSAAGKVMWVGRATVFLVGLAVILALLFGVASTAFAHGGDKGFFHLGHRNVTSKVSKLIKRGAGPALNLRVGSGPPLTVNSSEKVTNLNSDQIDGKHASQLGVNGLETVTSESLQKDSTSFKTATVYCPSGKRVIGTGGTALHGKRGPYPNRETDVVITNISPDPGLDYVTVTAYEEEPTSANWWVTATAICATAP